MRSSTGELFVSPWPLKLADGPFDLDLTVERDRYALAVEVEFLRLHGKLTAVASMLEDL